MEKSIVFIIPYFGKWPLWFDAHLISIAKNPSINWVCHTDCEVPEYYPDNIKFIKTTLNDLNEKFNDKLKANIPLNIRKLCDLRPSYGYVFEDEIIGYDFWGICDMDIIWGDIRKFITNEMLNNNDLISSRVNEISGHFTIIKNTSNNCTLFTKDNDYKKVFLSSKHWRYDEVGFTKLIKKLKEKNELRICWDEYLLNNNNGSAHQEYMLDKWQWKDGKMMDVTNGKEVMYLHFINWKRTMNYCEINYDDSPTQFYISYTGMHYKLHSKFDYYINDLKNIFNGYYVKLKKRKVRIKIKSFIKRLKSRLNRYHKF